MAIARGQSKRGTTGATSSGADRVGATELEARLAGLAVRYGLGPPGVRRLRGLLDLLVDDPLAPTAIRAPLKVIDEHLADSLVALELDRLRTAVEIADLGAGAGLPALPLAIALPQARFTLVESAARKCAFLDRAVARCELTNARVLAVRAESWWDGRGRSDLITARALAPLATVLEYAAPLLRLGGTLVVWRGHRDPEAERAAERAATVLGMRLLDVRRVRPYPRARAKHLHLIEKVGETPPAFPRRSGMAAKRPLGTSRSSPRPPRASSSASSARPRRSSTSSDRPPR